MVPGSGFVTSLGFVLLSTALPGTALRAQSPEVASLETETICTEPLFDTWPAGTPPTSWCELLWVRCSAFPDVRRRVVEVRRTEPGGGATAGTVVVIAGGSGTGWYGDTCTGTPVCERDARDVILEPLVLGGHQVIEYRWLQPNGWLESKSNGGRPLDEEAWQGFHALSCRVDRLVRFLRTSRHFGGPYCGVGQSGGAVQLAYTVAHHGAERMWDSLLLTGGPPINDLVFGCQEDQPCDQVGSEALGCFNERSECLVDQAYGNPQGSCNTPDSGGSVGPCQVDPLPTDPDWIQQATTDSLVNDDGDYDYFDTGLAVHFLLGGDDLSEAPAQAMKFRRELNDAGTETTCESLVGIGHGVPWGGPDDPSEIGPTAVLDRIQAYCVPPPMQPPPAPFDELCTEHHPNPVP